MKKISKNEYRFCLCAQPKILELLHRNLGSEKMRLLHRMIKDYYSIKKQSIIHTFHNLDNIEEVIMSVRWEYENSPFLNVLRCRIVAVSVFMAHGKKEYFGPRIC